MELESQRDDLNSIKMQFQRDINLKVENKIEKEKEKRKHFESLLKLRRRLEINMHNLFYLRLLKSRGLKHTGGPPEVFVRLFYKHTYIDINLKVEKNRKGKRKHFESILKFRGQLELDM